MTTAFATPHRSGAPSTRPDTGSGAGHPTPLRVIEGGRSASAAGTAAVRSSGTA